MSCVLLVTGFVLCALGGKFMGATKAKDKARARGENVPEMPAWSQTMGAVLVIPGVLAALVGGVWFIGSVMGWLPA